MKTLVIALAIVASATAAVSAREQIAVGSRVGSAPPSGYDDGGRRDPFVSLIVAKKAPVAASDHPVAGLAGLSLSDTTVTGIVRAGKAVIAILQGPDGKSFMAHNQDKLQDAVVKSIDADSVVFVAQVSDAAGITRPREIRKAIHVVAGGGK